MVADRVEEGTVGCRSLRNIGFSAVVCVDRRNGLVFLRAAFEIHLTDFLVVQ